MSLPGRTWHWLALGMIVGCGSDPSVPPLPPAAAPEAPARTFATSFESIDDFAGMYIAPPGSTNTSHNTASDFVHSGRLAHKAWILAPNPVVAGRNTNHRGYPTIQLWRLAGGSFRTPASIRFWARVHGTLHPRSPENDWASLATLTCDSTDAWSRTVLVNIDVDHRLDLMHVPLQGEKVQTIVDSTRRFPFDRWVKLDIRLRLGNPGSVQVWQDDTLASSAVVQGCSDRLAQAHFGLYAAPLVDSLTIWNDDLEIRELESNAP